MDTPKTTVERTTIVETAANNVPSITAPVVSESDFKQLNVLFGTSRRNLRWHKHKGYVALEEFISGSFREVPVICDT